MSLIDYLPTGRENAICARDLAKVAGFKDTRSLTAEIHCLRRAGHLICSAVSRPAGFFIAENDDEIKRFVHSINGRIDEIKAAIEPAEQHLTDR